MGEKGHGGATTVPERDERVRFAVTRLCTSTSDVDSATAIAHKFGCGRRTANRYLRAGKAVIGAGLPAEIEGWRTLVRATLLWLLENDTDYNGIRSTLKQVTDLLGLAAPARSEVAVTAQAPLDLLAVYAEHPDLMEKALSLEEDIENARSDSPAVVPGAARHSGLADTATLAAPPASGNGDARKSNGQPPRSGDAGQAR